MPISSIENKNLRDSLASFIGSSNTVSYYLSDTYYPLSIPLSESDRYIIDSILRKVDAVTGLSIALTDNISEADIVYTKVSDGQYQDGRVSGEASVQSSHILVSWKSDKSIINFENDSFVLHHETGHAFGLGHPDGQGDNPNYTLNDTIMSYNKSSNTIPGFRDLDIKALQSFWGQPGTGGSESSDNSSIGIKRIEGTDLPDSFVVPLGEGKIFSRKEIDPGLSISDEEGSWSRKILKKKLKGKNSQKGSTYDNSVYVIEGFVVGSDSFTVDGIDSGGLIGKYSVSSDETRWYASNYSNLVAIFKGVDNSMFPPL